MDSITHIVLGACIGDAVFSKKMGKKGMLIGAIAQSFPDSDILGTIWLPLSENLNFHRGFTHSFFFGFFMAFILALITQKIFKKQALSFKKLAIFYCLQMWLHDILDTCNSYGTGLFEPFSHHRFSINLLFVADPFFTIPLIIATIALIVLKTTSPARKSWIIAGLILPCFYLIYSVSNKDFVDENVSKSLVKQNIQNAGFITTPTPFNTWLWYIMVPTDTGVYIGYRSVYDTKNYVTPFTFYPKNEQLLSSRENSKDVINLKKFADSIYTVEKNNDSLIFTVPRFGRIAGWDNKPTTFNFQFYLNDGFNNNLVIQRGRVKELNKKIFARMYYRIKGIGKN